jgi:hypothetical protein
MNNQKKDIEQQLDEYFKNIPEDDEQSKLCLNLGIPIYYTEDNLDEDYMIKEFSNGQRQLIRWKSINQYEVINDNYK